MNSPSLDTINLWAEKPQVFVRDVFGVTPDAWQDEVLSRFPTTPRIAERAAKGPGKTATESWLAWNFLLTRPHPNVAATSISGDNLSSNLWKEMAVWQNKSPLLQQTFQWTASKIFAKAHPSTWVMYARTWPKTADREQLGNTLAGLHSDYLLFIVDESGSIPPEILLSAEAGFSSAKECHIIQAGNTNSLSGALYHACVKHKHLWKVVTINGDPDNPMRSPRISLEWAKEQIATYGRDNPFIKVSILGEWPTASFNALIGPSEVEEAMKRAYREYQYGGAAKVLGVDVARNGAAASVITKRQGLVVFPYERNQVLRGVSSIQGAGTVARIWGDWDADACFIDMTGGFGAGWYDQLGQLGRAPIGVQYAGDAHDPHRYFNKRAEMYFDGVDWIKRGGQLPECPELLAILPEINYTFKGDRTILEPKEDIEARLGMTLDHADSFVQTFAEPVTAKNQQQIGGRREHVAKNFDYDPFKSMFEGSDR